MKKRTFHFLIAILCLLCIVFVIVKLDGNISRLEKQIEQIEKEYTSLQKLGRDEDKKKWLKNRITKLRKHVGGEREQLRKERNDINNNIALITHNIKNTSDDINEISSKIITIASNMSNTSNEIKATANEIITNSSKLIEMNTAIKEGKINLITLNTISVLCDNIDSELTIINNNITKVEEAGLSSNLFDLAIGFINESDKERVRKLKSENKKSIEKFSMLKIELNKLKPIFEELENMEIKLNFFDEHLDEIDLIENKVDKIDENLFKKILRYL